VVETKDSARDLPSSQSLAVHREAIFRYVLSVVRDPSVAEDLTQETFLRAHRHRTSLENASKLVPWLYRVATNVCHDRFRQASYRHRPSSLEGDPESIGAVVARAAADTAPRLDKVMEQDEMSSCVQSYLADLSDSYRAVILLHDAEGLTNPEIAEVLGVSVPTVKIRLHRARAKLRDALTRACSFSTDERGVVVCDPKSGDSGD